MLSWDYIDYFSLFQFISTKMMILSIVVIMCNYANYNTYAEVLMLVYMRQYKHEICVWRIEL